LEAFARDDDLVADDEDLAEDEEDLGAVDDDLVADTSNGGDAAADVLDPLVDILVDELVRMLDSRNKLESETFFECSLKWSILKQ